MTDENIRYHPIIILTDLIEAPRGRWRKEPAPAELPLPS